MNMISGLLCFKKAQAIRQPGELTEGGNVHGGKLPYPPSRHRPWSASLL